MTLYSYNQMIALFGKDDFQVKKIKAYLDGLQAKENYSLKAFKRIEQK